METLKETDTISRKKINSRDPTFKDSESKQIENCIADGFPPTCVNGFDNGFGIKIGQRIQIVETFSMSPKLLFLPPSRQINYSSQRLLSLITVIQLLYYCKIILDKKRALALHYLSREIQGISYKTLFDDVIRLLVKEKKI